MNISFEWEENFPKGYGHTSVAFLKRCPGFEDAKNGDLEAAKSVINKCVKQDRLCELRKQYPDAVLLPVLSKNCLPLALAQEIKLTVWSEVRLLNIVSRKSLCGINRLLHKPIFTGYIQKDISYILVDDVITQGGTIAALREFVITRGGKVVAVVALAYAIGSHAVAPAQKYIIRLTVKFRNPLTYFLQTLEIVNTVYALTNSQAKYLLRFLSLNNVIKKIAQNFISCSYLCLVNYALPAPMIKKYTNIY